MRDIGTGWCCTELHVSAHYLPDVAPGVKKHFGGSSEFEGLGNRLSIAVGILFINVTICSTGVLLGNIYTDESMFAAGLHPGLLHHRHGAEEDLRG